VASELLGIDWCKLILFVDVDEHFVDGVDCVGWDILELKFEIGVVIEHFLNVLIIFVIDIGLLYN
jgi:hypothetical protein